MTRSGPGSSALDTLFLAFPVSFKGRIVQYVGRVLRAHDDKTDLEVHDYVDILSPVLKATHAKRVLSYAELGFDVKPQRRKCPSAYTTTLELWCADPAVRPGYRRYAYGRACCVVR